jgi:hypothetical protein
MLGKDIDSDEEAKRAYKMEIEYYDRKYRIN